MNVSELAKQLNVNSDDILSTLKSLKLKAKDGKQELSSAVISVLKSEIKKLPKAPVPAVALKLSKPPEAVESPSAKTQKVAKKKIESVAEPGETKTKKAVKKKEEPKEAETKKKFTKFSTKIVKKKTPVSVPVKETLKPKSSISDEPVITLKPLSRKRKKTPPQRFDVRSSSGLAQPSSTEESEGKIQELHEAAPADAIKEKREEPIQEEPPKPQMLPRDESLPDMEIRVPITVKDFSSKIGEKPSIVLKKLMQMSIFAHINQSLDGEIVDRLTREFGYNLAKIKTREEQVIFEHKEQEEDAKLLKHRAPVVTFMGHVDHGKTTLLDAIRKSKVVDTEHGGITQHIGAYSVKLPKGKITFLDTPGHEAFTAMRARGAHITDIVVLVIAADEGIMPQTEEALNHARAAEVPIVIALTKIDKKNIDLDRVKKQLMEYGLTPEEWGGKSIVCGVSGMTGEGVDQLLEMILLESELLELKANYEKNASGIVVEAHLSQGRGAVTTLIVQSGTLKDGDSIVVGPQYGKVKAMFDDHQRIVKEAGPSTPVEILGLPDVPQAGDNFYVVDEEKQAKEIATVRQQQMKSEKMKGLSKITLEDLYSQIQKGAIKELNVIVKADVQGSLEALKDSLAKIPSEKVKLKFIHAAVGDVNLSDVLLAVASQAIIIAFHVGVGPRAKKELEKHPVDIREYRIIYDAVNDVKKALEGLLEAKTKKKFISRIEIRQVFNLSKHGAVAGCYVQRGKVNRKANVDIVRNESVVYSGIISSLKRFKDDVREVTEGMECGITIDGFTTYEVGDIIEAYELEKIAQSL